MSEWLLSRGSWSTTLGKSDHNMTMTHLVPRYRSTMKTNKPVTHKNTEIDFDRLIYSLEDNFWQIFIGKPSLKTETIEVF